MVALERNRYGHPLASLLWERQFEEVLLEVGWEKVPNWECLFDRQKHGSFLLENVEDIKMAGGKQNMAPMWKKLMNNVDLDEPTSFLDHVYVGCTQRQCKVSENIIDQYRDMFESRISAGATEKLPGCEKSHTKTVAWSCDMKGHARKCVERYCELAVTIAAKR